MSYQIIAMFVNSLQSVVSILKNQVQSFSVVATRSNAYQANSRHHYISNVYPFTFAHALIIIHRSHLLQENPHKFTYS